ncbi:MAG TPA: hypothetical protein VFK37_05665 [Bacillales bacterium]|nr:hypothetical protein [Bacillales bacterium]
MKKKRMIIPAIIILMLILCHLSPKAALRAHLFTEGYFVSSFTTTIIDDFYHNRTDHKSLFKEHAKCYTLTRPPVERQTKGILANWKVNKIGLFYFVTYYGYV